MAEERKGTTGGEWALGLRSAMRNRLVLSGAAIVLLLVVLAIFADVIAPYDPTEMLVMDALKGPSGAHWFGTDRYGRDVLS
ncbi:MAG: ABC transporter permease, partial [Acidobacteria bacterium]